MAKTFVLHDESVNTRGFRMLTSGANLEEFIKNPVMLLNHNDWAMPIGRWENIRKEDGKILADAVFDEADERAREVSRKVEGNFIRMASIGAWPPEETSDAFDLMIHGQSLPTVTKWTVREASIVTIGSNHNALCFYDRQSKQPISLKDEKDVIRLMDNTNHKTSNKMSILATLLKLSDGATEADYVSAVQRVISDNDRLKQENVTLKDAVDKAAKERKENEKKQAIVLVDAAVKEGRIDANGKDTYLALFDKDFASASAALAAIPKRAGVAAQIAGASQTVDLGDWKNKTWEELDKADKLVELRDQYPDLYDQKFEQRFGVKPKK